MKHETKVALVAIAAATALAVVMIWSRPAVSAEPQKFTIELEQNDLSALSAAINELPKRVADPLIAKINEQLKLQVAKQQVEAESKKVLTPPSAEGESTPVPMPDIRKRRPRDPAPKE